MAASYPYDSAPAPSSLVSHAALLKDGDVVGGYDRQCVAPGKVTLEISAAIGRACLGANTQMECCVGLYQPDADIHLRSPQ